jgi:hypothetical protein
MSSSSRRPWTAYVESFNFFDFDHTSEIMLQIK